MSLQGIHRRAFLLLLLGVSICGIGGAINYTKYHLVTASLQALEVSAVPKDLPPQNQWNAALTAIERERMGVLIARDAYLHSGRIVTYIDQSQLTKVFVPTQEDIQKRESTVSGVAELRQLASGRFTDSILWLSWFVLALLLGFSHAQVSKSNGR